MILITGVAGFIGFHVARELLARGESVLGLDNLNKYYDPTLKKARLTQLQNHHNFEFIRMDLTKLTEVKHLFSCRRFTKIIHLAAQAGVRYSFTHPHAYTAANVEGFLNMLEGARLQPPEHFIYASSSSVYGANTKLPFSETDQVNHPVSLYAATKRANELMAEVYANQFNLRLTGLRFFTVYGPWGRPDMAPIKFTKSILNGTSIDVYNNGIMSRDFTYIDDIVDGVLRIIYGARPLTGYVAHRIYNLGNRKPEKLMDFIAVLASILDREPLIRLLPMQPGEVFATYADISAMQTDYGWVPTTEIKAGLKKMVEWYQTQPVK